MRFVLVLLVLVALPTVAAAQDDKTPRPDACTEVCPPCPPIGPCPPCEPVCAVSIIGSAQVVLPATAVVGAPPATPPAPAPATPPPAPVAPAPGTLELGYFGAFDGSTLMSGGGLRTTGHVTDVWFVDLILGGTGGDLGGGRSLWEFIGMLGVRAMGPVLPNILRLFAALDTGITARGYGGMPDAPVWGAFAFDAGGGLEVGFDSRFTAGFFVDLRLQTRVPFEREPAFLGAAWSAGIAVMWF